MYVLQYVIEPTKNVYYVGYDYSGVLHTSIDRSKAYAFPDRETAVASVEFIKKLFSLDFNVEKVVYFDGVSYVS